MPVERLQNHRRKKIAAKRYLSIRNLWTGRNYTRKITFSSSSHFFGKRCPRAPRKSIRRRTRQANRRFANMCLGGIVQEEKKDDERRVWEAMAPSAWHNSVARKDSIFCETYEMTRNQIQETATKFNHDVIIEVGCGTGDIIGLLDTSIPHYGIDINPDFIAFCQSQYPNCTFEVEDATTIVDWWKEKNFDKIYHSPLLVCVNNTLNIMPEDIRGTVVSQMLAVAGETGRCVVSYWNGNFFSHAVMNYYKKNEPLCGKFDPLKDADWENRSLVTPEKQYCTEWHTPEEVRKILRAFDVDVDKSASNSVLHGEDHMNCQGLAICVWFSMSSTSRAKDYYDSDDAQKFYSNIWGQETVHIGRYDMLTEEDKSMPLQQQISKAQEYQEDEFAKLIKSKFPNFKVRVLDMGCGYGGLLRRLWESDVVWSAIGCDIANKMCRQAQRLNADLGCDKDITILEESYLDVSVADESVDLVTSMDALLHVGPENQHKAIAEAARVLRPGGWMIFTDILEHEQVDPIEMKPIYDRICLSRLGTVSNYKTAMDKVGFGNFDFLEASGNVANHYGTVRQVLLEKGEAIGLSKEYQKKMEAGLLTWRELAPKNIRWGFIVAQKVNKVN